MNKYLILYTIYARILILFMGIYIYRLKQKMKKYQLRGPIGYMCSTDYAHELSWGEPGVGVGSSVEIFDSLNGAKNKSCTHECGITKVQLLRLETVTNPDHLKLTRSKS